MKFLSKAWINEWQRNNYWRPGWRGKACHYLNRWGNAWAAWKGYGDIFKRLEALETENKQLKGWRMCDACEKWVEPDDVKLGEDSDFCPGCYDEILEEMAYELQ